MATITSTSLTVQDIMTPDPACIHPSDTVREAARVMTDNEISGVPVINERGSVVGVVTRTDLLRRCFEGPRGSRRGTMLELVAGGLSFQGEFDAAELGIIEEFMSTDLVTCFADDAAFRAGKLMVLHDVHRVIVVNESMEPVGIVSALDLLAHFPKTKHEGSNTAKGDTP